MSIDIDKLQASHGTRNVAQWRLFAIEHSDKYTYRVIKSPYLRLQEHVTLLAWQ